MSVSNASPQAASMPGPRTAPRRLFFSLLLPLLLFVPVVEAVEISGSYEQNVVRLFVPGLYYQASVERAEGPAGPFMGLGMQYYGCTEACEFFDAQVAPGTTYWYRMVVIPADRSMLRIGPVPVVVPRSDRPFQAVAAPNPFQSEVLLRFRVPAFLTGDAAVRVFLYDAQGRQVRMLDPEGTANAVGWDGRDQGGRLVSDGVYLYVIQAGRLRETGRVVKVR